MALKYPKDQGTEWFNLKEQVKSAFTSANSRVPYQKITAGVLRVASSLEVLAGGFVKFVYSTNITGMLFGHHTTGGNDAEGMFIRRPDGTIAFWIYTKEIDGTGGTRIYDQQENTIFADDGTSKKGLSKPWLDLPVIDTAELTTPPAGRQATGTTDTVVQSALVPIQHPKIRLWGYIYTAVGGATAEVKLKDLTTGTTIASGTSASGYLILESNTLDYDFLDYHQLDITIRRASGTGNVGWTTVSMYGRQS